MGNHFFNGVPVEQVDFENEYRKELALLESRINQLKEKENSGKKMNYQYWTLKLARANKVLEIGQVVLD